LAPGAAPQRLALTAPGGNVHTVRRPGLTVQSSAPNRASEAEESSIARAIRTVTDCQKRFKTVSDYSCTFYKQERINGRMTPLYVMAMKARTNPKSIYFRFNQPCRGREAIYVDGRHGGRVLAHEVGLTRFLAGTMELDPNGE